MKKLAWSGLICLLPAALVQTAGCGGANPAGVAPGSARSAAAGIPTASCERRAPGVGAARTDGARQGSSVALAHLGDSTIAYVADEDSQTLRTVDVGRGAEVATTRLQGSPALALVLADGRVAVTLRDKNKVEILEPAARASQPLESRCTVPVAVEPFGLATTPDDKQLLVTSAFGRKLTVLDAASGRPRFDVAVGREPRAVLVDDRGERAFVAHVVGGKMSVVDLASDKHDVREIDLRVKKVLGQASRASGDPDKLRSGCQGFALAKSISEDVDPKGERPIVKGEAPKQPAPARPKGRVFAPMVTVDPGDALTRSTQYYGEVRDGVPKEAPIVEVIDADAERPMTKTVMSLGTRLSKECLLPRSATARASTGTLFVTCLGIDAVVELDTRGADPARLERRRWSVPAGPTGVAIDDASGRAVVWSQFDAKLSILDLRAGAEKPVSTEVAVSSHAPSAEATQLALGRKLFHTVDDARISSDGSACASCHPDGREDALTWSTPDGPRQTIMLAGRLAATAPYGWVGKHDTLPTYVTNTFTRLGGIGMQGPELDALVAYVGKMPGPVMEGAPVDPAKAAQLARGKELFFDQAEGCASCHVGGGGVDAAHHDVGSITSADLAKEFDTPSLRFIGGTAPYFHDGRYKTLDDVLAATDNQMGHTLHLSQRDGLALKAYLETL